MKILLILISIAGLVLTVTPAILVFSHSITLATHKELMVAGMVMWFFTAPLWIKEKQEI